MENNNTNNAQQSTNGEPPVQATERTFTQDEVNNIVSERLNRERQKTEPTAQDLREKDLNERESKIKCNEFIGNGNKYPKQFLDMFDTTNFDKFKETADKLITAFPELSPENKKNMPVFSSSTPGWIGGKRSDEIAEAFQLK